MALQEVLSRRLKHKEYKDPDLILIDGGKGQLQVVQKILKDFGKKDWPVVSLAKDRVREEKNDSSQIKSTGSDFICPDAKIL